MVHNDDSNVRWVTALEVNGLAISERASFVQQITPSAEIAARFPDFHPGFDKQAAIPESNRCLFCFDAPCTTACPTHIDVPRFIKKIASGNIAGAAYTILDANILGGSCARACPVEVLCEGACVLHRYNKQPIQIARLQRYAVDALYNSGAPLPFEAGADTGYSVALVGAGPASLACAAELRRRGISAALYDARPLPGGLNTYGIAEYKLPLVESLREIEMLTQLGVQFHFKTVVDAALLASLEQQHDAVFLGMGLGAIHKLGIANESVQCVTNALDLINGYKSGTITSMPPRVVVIGAGNTAIDAAIAAVRLGSTDVSIVYRRGPEQMSAFAFEYEHARVEGVKFLWFVQPVAIESDGDQASLKLQSVGGSGADTEVFLPADKIVLAIGQATHADFLGSKVELNQGRIVIDRATGQTSNQRYFAGGDCTNGGREVVDAVADGKRAAIGIAAWLEGKYAKA
jgi:glutamate synthase (NADPH/NADH) small chain